MTDNYVSDVATDRKGEIFPTFAMSSVFLVVRVFVKDANPFTFRTFAYCLSAVYIIRLP